MVRHYTHLAERMAGMARNADVSLDALLNTFCRSIESPVPRDGALQPTESIGAVRISDLGGGALVRGVPGFACQDAAWFIRKSVPEVGFASVEVTQPWLATAVGGINEAGVAVVFVAQASEVPEASRRRAAPNVLLVQECLQRFEDVGGCIDWCNKRPHSGAARLTLIDRAGDLVAVELIEGSVRILEPSDGIITGTISPERMDVIETAQRSQDGLRLADLMQEASSDDALLVLEPDACRLSLRSLERPAETLESVELDR